MSTADTLIRGVEETPAVAEVAAVGVPEPQSLRAETIYEIFIAADLEGAWAHQTQVQARSAEAAVRAYVDMLDHVGADGLTVVAVPSRSWKPVRVKPQVVTTIVIEEA